MICLLWYKVLASAFAVGSAGIAGGFSGGGFGGGGGGGGGGDSNYTNCILL